MKKQTAVQWLALKFSESSEDELAEKINIWFGKAIAMEKENSEISFFAGYNYEGGHPIDEHEQYYNETYNLTEPICDECGDGSGWYGNDIYPEYGSITMNCSKCNPQAE
jgi:hypothetical protein